MGRNPEGGRDLSDELLLHKHADRVLLAGLRRGDLTHLGQLRRAVTVFENAEQAAALDARKPEPRAEPVDYRERCAQLTGERIDICPFCGGVGSWPHRSPPPPTRYCDTS